MNALVFLLPCVGAFVPAPPAVSNHRLPATAATAEAGMPNVAPYTLTDDAALPPLAGQPQIVTDAIATATAKAQMDFAQPMPAQSQALRPAQAQAAVAAAAAAEPEQNASIFSQPGIMGASIAGFFASMFGAAGLVLHRRKAEKRSERLAANAAAVALAIASATAGATPAFAGNAANGEQIFSGNCAACHAGGNNVIQAEKTLKKDALVEYLAGGFKEESIVYQVTNGKNAMPAFGGRLSDEEIADVAAYVYKTSNADSWE